MGMSGTSLNMTGELLWATRRVERKLSAGGESSFAVAARQAHPAGEAQIKCR